MRHVDRHFLVREGSEADPAAAIDHAHGVVDGAGRGRTFDNIVDALAAVQLLHRSDHVWFLADINHRIGAELEADLQPVVARAGEDHRLGAERLRHRHRHQADRTRAGNDDAFAGDQAAKFGERIHRSAGGDDERAFLVRHLVGNRDQRVDVVHLVFAETAIGSETVGAVALVHVAVVETVVVAGGVHALAAALALAATGMEFDRHARTDFVFVDTGPERDHRPHVFMAGREVLVERQAALDRRRRAVIDNLKISGADCHRVDAHQHLRLFRYRHRLLLER